MNTPSDRSALEVKEDGLIYIDGILCQDQEKATRLLIDSLLAKNEPILNRSLKVYLPPGIYPILDLKWEVKEVLGVDDTCETWDEHNCSCPYPCGKKEVAVLSPSSIEDPSFLNHEAWHSAFEEFNKSHKQQIKPYEQLLQFFQRRFLLHRKGEKKLRFCDKCGEMYDTSKWHECYYTFESQTSKVEGLSETAEEKLTLQQLVTRIKQRAYLDTDEQIGQWIKEFAAQFKSPSVVEQKWISVDERLPDEGQIVLAANSDVHYCKYERAAFYRWTEPSNNDRIIMYYHLDVTHWASIPEPPRKSQPL